SGGTRWLAIHAPGFAEERVELPVSLEDVHRVDVTLLPATTLVVDCFDEQGLPLAGIHVEIEPWSERTREEQEGETDETGRIVFEDLPPGQIEVTIKTKTYLRPEKRIVDPRSGPQFYVLRLPVSFAGRIEL